MSVKERMLRRMRRGLLRAYEGLPRSRTFTHEEFADQAEVQGWLNRVGEANRHVGGTLYIAITDADLEGVTVKVDQGDADEAAKYAISADHLRQWHQ